MPANTPVYFGKEAVSGELTPLLDKNLNILRKLAKIVALLLEPLGGPLSMERNQPSGTPSTRSCSKIRNGNKTVWEYIQSFVSLVLPLTHPSNVGKWTVAVSHFVSAFILAYTRRVGRERMSTAVVNESTGRVCITESGVVELSHRMGREEDEKVVELFLPVLLQGIYSKNQSAGASCESGVKRLCYLLPETTLERLLEQLVAALEAVTESHQLQVSLRLLTQLIPLILQRTPGMVPQLLTLTLPAIDGAEPFKTVQALTFYSVLFSRIVCKDLSSIEVDDIPIEKVANVSSQ